MRLLILGGTTEASRLAAALADRADIMPLLSLAGRTENPKPSPVPCRIGGFGGADGLADFLRQDGIDAVVDATHPFAARISAHAIEATARTALPLAVFTRPPWTAQPGDDWQSVPDLHMAALVLGPSPKRVFLTSGRLGLSAFKAAPQHRYLLRSIDPPALADQPPLCDVILARGPFSAGDEETVMRRNGVEILVSKNSGGEAGAAKLHAARTLGIRVLMVDRPAPGGPPEALFHLGDVMAWIEHHRTAAAPC